MEDKVLVTRSVVDAQTAKINQKIDNLLGERASLINELKTAKAEVKVNKSKFNKVKKQYKLEKKEARKMLKAKIKAAMKEYRDTVRTAAVPYNESKEVLSDSQERKAKTSDELSDVRSQIKYLKNYKNDLEKKYTSEKDEYISEAKYL